MKLRIALFATAAILGSSTARASDLDLVNALMACTGKLAATKNFDSQVEDLPAIRVSAKEALEYLMGGERLSRDRREAITQQTAAFEQVLLSSPMDARNLVTQLRNDCIDLIYDAEDARKETVAKDEETARAAREAEIAAKIEAERRDRLEMEKLRLEASKDHNRTLVETTKIRSNTEVTIAESINNVETHKVAASVDIAKIEGETERYKADKEAEVAIVRSGDDVEKTKIKADASVDMTKQMAQVAVVKSADDVEKTRIRADAAVNVTKEVAKVEIAKTETEVETTKLKTEAATEIATRMVDATVKVEQIKRSSQLSLDDADRTTGALIIEGNPAKILGVALGDGVEACSTEIRQIKLTKGAAGKNAPEALVNVCQSGNQLDRVVLFFDGDAKFVVRIQRDVWLTAGSEAIPTLDRVTKTYGTPKKVTDGGMTLVYSSEQEVDGRKSPKGLRVRYLDCGAKQCRGKDGHDRVLSFNMLDVLGFAEAIKSGAAKLQSQHEQSAEAIKF